MMKAFMYIAILAAVPVLSFFSCGQRGTPADTAIVSGTVSDFEGNPLGNVTVAWKGPDFNDVVKTVSDESGRYEAVLPKGRYYSMIAVDFDRYPHTAAEGLPPEEMRLEFWGWNYIADKDTTLDIRYDRLEVYGLNAFRIQGAYPAFTVFFRPMSLTRMIGQMEKGDDPNIHGAPDPSAADIKVWIDGERVTVHTVRTIKEHIGGDNYADAYLMSVGLPSVATEDPYHFFRVEMTDLDNGDRGEAVYFLEKAAYVNESQLTE